MTLSNVVVTGDSESLDAARTGLAAMGGETDRVVVSVLDAARVEWSGAAADARAAVLDVAVTVLHRVYDAVTSVSRASAELARAVEDTEARIDDAVRSAPVWPAEPEPLPVDAGMPCRCWRTTDPRASVTWRHFDF